MTKNKTIYLKDYTVSNFLIEKTNLDFEIHDDYTLVTAKIIFYKNPDSNEGNTLKLDGNNLELQELYLDEANILPLLAKEGAEGSSEDARGSYDTNNLTIGNFPEKATLKTVVKIYPAENTSLEGLYKSGDIFCTQCESQGFRSITYYLDRPDVMTTFTVKISAKKATFPELLSNGNMIEAGDVEGGRHYRIWEDPFKKPAYLFALVAGDLEHISDSFTTMSGKQVDLKIFAAKKDIDKCDFAMGALKRAMKWDEERFGREYDLDLFMIVGVDDFNSGAMENKGLNIFNSSLIFATPQTATDANYEYIEAVIGHEYFHNWTGNRVTCRDWFQLSLKEGLTVFRDAEFTSDLHSRALKRIEDVNVLRNHQFKEDASPMAHPIRPASFQEIRNFYTVTVYEKGAEIIKIYETLLGVDGFRKGTDLYFERHDGQAVTTEDFLKAMGDANGVDLSQIQNWYDQAGTPTVTVQGTYDAQSKTYMLHCTQSCPATPESDTKKPFLIPIKVGLILESGEEITLKNDMCILTEAEQTFTFENIESEPIPSLLRGFSAPVKLEYDYSIEDYIFLMQHDSDEFNRFEATRNFMMHELLLSVADENYTLSQTFFTAFERVFTDENIEKSLKAQMIVLPSVEEIAQKRENDINYPQLERVRTSVQKQIAEHFQNVFSKMYDELVLPNEYHFVKEDIATRSLSATVLHYLSIVEGDEQAYEKFTNANNMTDQLSSLKTIVFVNGEHKKAALNSFIEQWKHDTNVVDKWFSIQAMYGTLDEVQALVEHELFDIKNPNKVRSVYNAFANYNFGAFHTQAGYRFVGNAVSKLSTINSAIAARLVKSMMNWKDLCEPNRTQLKGELETIFAEKDLPSDVSEIVEKSLR